MADDKVFLVTGATSGIGKAVAIGLGRAGYKIAILGRRADALATVARR
ncbi:MAG: SDR family NAD(P)-dependent oxidoreductase [Novosphingobium sp.]